jgi:hypothetical protein
VLYNRDIIIAMQAKRREKRLARKLRAQGYSLRQIADCLAVAKSSVSLWVRDVDLTVEQKNRLRERELAGAIKGREGVIQKWKKYRKLHPRSETESRRWPERPIDRFFDQWSEDMAYVLGYFAADGCMYKNKNGSCYIAFYSCDIATIRTIKGILKVRNKIESYKPANKKHNTRYNLQVGGWRIYNRLSRLGFTPNKSLILKFPIIPREMLGHFARGYFDGDGNVYSKQIASKNGGGDIQS